MVHASSSPRTAARKPIRRTGPNNKDSKKASTNGPRRGSKPKDNTTATTTTATAPAPAPTATTSTKSEKEEEKKPKPRSVRPKNAGRFVPRKAPAFVNIDADTLKMYIMQQM